MKLTRIVAAAGLMVAAGLGGVALAGPAAAYPAGVQGEAAINATTFAPGQTATVVVTKTTPGDLTMQIFSAPAVIGKGTTGANGNGSVSGVIPAGFSGAHTIQVIGAGGELYSFSINVTSTSSTGGGSGSGGGLANTGAAVTGIGILGGVLVAGGVFFVVAGRRRSASQTPSV